MTHDTLVETRAPNGWKVGTKLGIGPRTPPWRTESIEWLQSDLLFQEEDGAWIDDEVGLVVAEVGERNATGDASEEDHLDGHASIGQRGDGPVVSREGLQATAAVVVATRAAPTAEAVAASVLTGLAFATF